MKTVFFILGILIVIDITYFAFINGGNPLSVNYKPIIKAFNIDLGVLIISTGLYGILGGFLITYSKVMELRDKMKKVSRDKERASISSEESSDKVKALEAKIQTLEAALKDALSK